jgi:hypothetical protein
MLRCLGWPHEVEARLTTDRAATPLWVVPLQHITFETAAAYAIDGTPHGADLDRQGGGGETKAAASPKLGPYDTVIAVRPTGWTHGGAGGGASSARSSASSAAASAASAVLSVRERRLKASNGRGPVRLVMVGAPYSEHSSFPELLDCVAALAARRVVPTVNCHTEAAVESQLGLLMPHRASSGLFK